MPRSLQVRVLPLAKMTFLRQIFNRVFDKLKALPSIISHAGRWFFTGVKWLLKWFSVSAFVVGTSIYTIMYLRDMIGELRLFSICTVIVLALGILFIISADHTGGHNMYLMKFLGTLPCILITFLFIAKTEHMSLPPAEWEILALKVLAFCICSIISIPANPKWLPHYFLFIDTLLMILSYGTYLYYLSKYT